MAQVETKPILKEYTRKWFAQHLRWKKTYSIIAKWMVKNLDFESVLDIGCGNAYINEGLLARGKEVSGIDGTLVVKDIVAKSIKPFIEIKDVTQKLDIPLYDMVVSTEVAEHLFEEFADIFVDNICSHARKWICFTAATTAGKKSRNHVNVQPHSYWIQKIQGHGFIMRNDLTDEFRKIDVSHAKWLIYNMMIFKK